MLSRLFAVSLLLMAAPALAEEAKSKNDLLNEVRLDHSDWTSNFAGSGALDQDDADDDSVRRLHIEKSDFGTDNSDDYQSPEE